MKGTVNGDAAYLAGVTYRECRENLKEGDRVLVIVKCFDGSFQIGEQNEVTTWLEREVFPHRYAEGICWRYYYLE